MQTNVAAQRQTTTGVGIPGAAVPASGPSHMPIPHPALVTIGESTGERISTSPNGTVIVTTLHWILVPAHLGTTFDVCRRTLEEAFARGGRGVYAHDT